MRRKIAIVATLVIVLALGWYGLHTINGRLVTRDEFMMGTFIEARAYGPKASKALDQIYARFAEIETRMTINSPGSEIDAVNQQAGKQPVAVTPDVFGVVQKALDYGQKSMGKFDITIEPITALWRIGFPDARVPRPEEITAALPLVGYQNVKLDPAKQTIYLEKPGMGIDLGGIAKGYSADEAVAIFRKNGVKSALISLGGNIYAVGKKPDGSPWRIGVQDPLDERGGYVGIVDAVDETLVTSGAYERYLDVGGKRYHHIIDPATGYPSNSDLISSTIVTAKSIDADALSTSLFILGREKGLALAKQLGIDVILIDNQHQVWVTEGLQSHFALTNEDYKLALK